MSIKLTNSLQAASKLFSKSKMPAFTLYGTQSSSNTKRVRLTLSEGGFTDYELAVVDLSKGEQKSAEHLKRHPWGKVPAMTTAEGFTLYESRAICRYLATKYSIPLFPPSLDLEATALFEQAQCVEMTYFCEPASRMSYEKFAKKMRGLPADEAVVSAALKEVEHFFDIQERLLKERSYMAGNEFTLVDIFYIPLIQRLFAIGYGETVTSREAVNAWWNRCLSRPAIQSVLAADEKAAAAFKR